MSRDPETPCVIDAVFYDWRTVKGRKCLQLVFEIPIEKQGEVLTLLGHPEPSGSKWCMIALKDVGKPAQARGAENAATTAAKRAEDKPKRKFSELSLAQQCAIRCEDESFQKFLNFHHRVSDHPETFPEMVRSLLNIGSRGELGKGNHDADNKWRKLESEYQQWLLDERYADVRRP
jgi:hypothetical protein